MVPRRNVLALQCVTTAFGEPDDDGRPRPVEIEGSEHEVFGRSEACLLQNRHCLEVVEHGLGNARALGVGQTVGQRRHGGAASHR